MNNLFHKIQSQYHYSDLEIAKLKYTLKAILSETSKLILMSIFFGYIHKLPQFFLGFIVLLLVRNYSGGLHFRHYISCFCFTFFIFFLGILILPNISLSLLQLIITLILYTCITFIIGPITSNNRPIPTKEDTLKFRKITFVILSCLSMLICIFKNNQYATITYWIIFLQTFQLIIAKIAKKGVTYEKKKLESTN